MTIFLSIRYQFTYVPRIYGFRISKSSQYFHQRDGQAMLRKRSNVTDSSVNIINKNSNADITNNNISPQGELTVEEIPKTKE